MKGTGAMMTARTPPSPSDTVVVVVVSRAEVIDHAATLLPLQVEVRVGAFGTQLVRLLPPTPGWCRYLLFCGSCVFCLVFVFAVLCQSILVYLAGYLSPPPSASLFLSLIFPFRTFHLFLHFFVLSCFSFIFLLACSLWCAGLLIIRSAPPSHSLCFGVVINLLPNHLYLERVCISIS